MRRPNGILPAAAAVAVAVLLLGHTARAQHGHTMLVTSDAAGGGALGLAWDFDGLPIARTVDSGLPGVFTGNVPGFNDGAGDGTVSFPLTDTTDVDVEIMSIDDGIRWIFGGTPVGESGETAFIGTMPSLHNHATFEITGDDANTFAEGEVSFRVVESTAVPFGYTASEVRSLTVSNGYLSPLAEATKEDLKCQMAVAAAVRGFTSKTYQVLGACVDAVLAHTMLEKSANSALKRCSVDELDDKSLIGTIAAAKAKALAKIDKRCGPLGDSSVPYTLSQIHTHLGMAQCRAEELAGATYNHAALSIGHVLEEASAGDAHDVQHAFPCMKASIE